MTKRRRILLAAAAVAAALALLFLFRARDEPYTARVVDAESGRPVEGAIYLAVWWRESANEVKPWWEGSATVMERFVEGRTGPDGIITVPGFWRRGISFNPNTLTVYKPGYVLWNQGFLFPTAARRMDFDVNRRIVELQGWRRSASYNDHERFLTTCFGVALQRDPYKAGSKSLLRSFEDHERPLRILENSMRGR